MRLKRCDALSSFVCKPMPSPANRRLRVRRSDDLRELPSRAEATFPVRRADAAIATALQAKRSRQFRSRDNPRASEFRWAIFVAPQELAATKRSPSLRQFPRKLPTSANAELWVAHASRVSGERVPRSRTFPGRPARSCDSHSKESLFRRDAETRHARRMRYPNPNGTLFAGNYAYGRGR